MVRPLINQKEYEGVAGVDWPTYEEYVAGNAENFVYTEIKNIFKQAPKIIPLSPTYEQQTIPQVAYDYKLNSLPRGANYKNKITNSCNRPMKTVTIDMFTNCMLCTCDGWLPKPVGKITDFEKLEDIWTNDIAVELQQNILDKKFTWCAVEHCGIKFASNYETTYKMTFGIDDSCNLKCPSCRREAIMYNSGPLFEMKIQAVNHAIKLLAKFDLPIHITLASSGDPLASVIYRPFLHSYIPKPNQTFTLFTNGLLIKKQLHKTSLLSKITEFKISIDAATKQTYEKVRLGGNWEILIESLNYLKSQNLNHLINFQFIVQEKNFRDITKFIELCNYYDCRGTLTQLDDWGTWVNENIETPDKWTLEFGTYLDNNVLDAKNKNYKECIDILKKIQTNKLTNVSMSPRLLELINE
jgi:molybdenum cofactor biosynthesis enzyme MoaA